jgi:signal transduction histidine kinase
VSFRHGGTTCLGVADSGPGFDDELARAVNNQDFRTAQQLTESSVAGQTGLGLGLIHEMAAARHGKVLAGRSAEGGAIVVMTIPEPSGADPGQAGRPGGTTRTRLPAADLSAR